MTQPDGLAVLRQVDAIFIQALKDGGLYDKIWQAFAVFLPVRYGTLIGLQETLWGSVDVVNKVGIGAFSTLEQASSCPSELPACSTMPLC